MSKSTADTANIKSRSTPKGKPTPKAKDNHQAQYVAYHKAKMQWYALAAVLTVAIVAAIILLSIYSDGSTGGGHG
jgi:hypothetical protein